MNKTLSNGEPTQALSLYKWIISCICSGEQGKLTIMRLSQHTLQFLSFGLFHLESCQIMQPCVSTQMGNGQRVCCKMMEYETMFGLIHVFLWSACPWLCFYLPTSKQGVCVFKVMKCFQNMSWDSGSITSLWYYSGSLASCKSNGQSLNVQNKDNI